MHELNSKIKELSEKFAKIKSSFHLDDKKKELLRLESNSMDPGFWDKQDEARKKRRNAS